MISLLPCSTRIMTTWSPWRRQGQRSLSPLEGGSSASSVVSAASATIGRFAGLPSTTRPGGAVFSKKKSWRLLSFPLSWRALADNLGRQLVFFYSGYTVQAPVDHNQWAIDDSKVEFKVSTSRPAWFARLFVRFCLLFFFRFLFLFLNSFTRFVNGSPDHGEAIKFVVKETSTGICPLQWESTFSFKSGFHLFNSSYGWRVRAATKSITFITGKINRSAEAETRTIMWDPVLSNWTQWHPLKK